jgi:hypothetical protein
LPEHAGPQELLHESGPAGNEHPHLKASIRFGAILVLIGIAGCQTEPTETAIAGGWSKVSAQDENVRKAAEAAVKSASINSGKPVSLVSIDEASQQVVAGMNYALKLTVKVGGTTQKAETTVWWQSWRPVPFEVTDWSFQSGR